MKLSRLIIVVVTGAMLMSCQNEEPAFFDNSLDELQISIMKMEKGVKPKNDNLQFVRFVTDKEKLLLKSFINSAVVKKRNYVFCEHYLVFKGNGESYVYGIVYRPDQKSIGIDVTSSNTVGLPISSTHAILYSKNQVLSDQLYKMVFAPDATPTGSTPTCH
jgi:hypothetical protein